MEESFINVIDKLKALKESSTLNQAETLSIGEVLARLKSLKTQSLKIIEANENLLERNPRLKEIREMMTDEKVNEMLQNAAKTDPSLVVYLASVGGRVKKENSSEISTYDMSNVDEISDAEEISNLHSETEAAYHSLWLAKERLNAVNKFQKFNPKGVREVRNDLMTHTKGSNSGAHIYSFGIATRGPVLRPVKPSGTKAPNDSGFESNLAEFLDELTKLLD